MRDVEATDGVFGRDRPAPPLGNARRWGRGHAIAGHLLS